MKSLMASLSMLGIGVVMSALVALGVQLTDSKPKAATLQTMPAIPALPAATTNQAEQSNSASRPAVHAFSAEFGGGNFNNQPSGPVNITSLNWSQLAGQKYLLSGTIAGTGPLNSCGVLFSGTASGILLADSSGKFSGVFFVATPGQVAAVAMYGTNQQSAPVNITLTNASPAVAITSVSPVPGSWSPATGGFVTFSGTATDDTTTGAAGLWVILNGPPGINANIAVVKADGTWSTTLGTDKRGLPVQVTITDWYGVVAKSVVVNLP